MCVCVCVRAPVPLLPRAATVLTHFAANMITPLPNRSSASGPNIRVPQGHSFRAKIAMGLYQSLEHASHREVSMHARATERCVRLMHMRAARLGASCRAAQHRAHR